MVVKLEKLRCPDCGAYGLVLKVGAQEVRLGCFLKVVEATMDSSSVFAIIMTLIILICVGSWVSILGIVLLVAWVLLVDLFILVKRYASTQSRLSVRCEQCGHEWH